MAVRDALRFNIHEQPRRCCLAGTVTQVTAVGEENGSIIINASGGVAPYTFVASDISGKIINNLTALQVGIYSITAKDANGCNSTPANFTVNLGLEKAPCPSYENNTGQNISNLFNSIKNKPQMSQLLQNNISATSSEGAITIENSTPSSPNNDNNYLSEVYTGTKDDVTHNFDCNTIANLHTHQASTVGFGVTIDGPSPKDLYNLLSMWNHPICSSSHVCNTSFVISGDGSQYAIAVTDPTAAQIFINNPSNASLFSSDGNWTGKSAISFNNYMMSFLMQGYSQNSSMDFANILLMNQFKMGITMYKNENGQFKGLKLSGTTITECQ